MAVLFTASKANRENQFALVKLFIGNSANNFNACYGIHTKYHAVMRSTN
jgi:hypothetical protein